MNYEVRTFVKDGREILCGSVGHEMQLRFAGWKPAADPPASAGPGSADSADEPPARRIRSKPAQPTE
jgi:hypothetical protein